jgi:rhodanese-related sulfurtransferase
MKRFFLHPKIFSIFTLILFLGLFLQPTIAGPPGAMGQLPNASENVVTSREAWKLIQKNTDSPDFIILDVRTPVEFFNKRIPGAINMDYSAPGFKRKLAKLDRQKTYLVYCKSGIRSLAVITLMAAMKFKSFFHLAGGVREWVKEGMPIQSGP